MADQEASIVAISDPGEVGRSEHNSGDRFSVHVSNAFAWLFPILMLAIVAQVILRSSGFNQAWLDDLQWWLYGSAVLFGIGYAVTTNSHVRVDIFFDNYDTEKKTKIEIFGLVWCLLPFIILCWDLTVHYAWSSIQALEGSDSPNGLHNLWILKCLMNLSFIFIGVAIWAAYHRFLAKLTEPTLFRQLLWAFPSTMYLINLVVYYVIWWFLKLTRTDPETGEALTNREVGRLGIFDTFEVGVEDIKYTIVITLVVTLLVLVGTFLRQRSKGY